MRLDLFKIRLSDLKELEREIDNQNLMSQEYLTRSKEARSSKKRLSMRVECLKPNAF